MRFKLREKLLLEGKDLKRTFEQYKEKLRNASIFDNQSDDDLYDIMLTVLELDPTYRPGGTTTGDFGIWLLNQEVKPDDPLYKFQIQHDVSIKDLLQEFIDKKANLANKDINSYKSPEQLYQILQQTEFSDRQKERQLRKNFKDAKLIGSTQNFNIWVPETYEASCALGKGSGWCTADSRTRKYYDYYKDEYGGDYYIAISKDGKYKFQFHFESNSMAAAGTNPDIDTPNEEETIDFEDLNSQWPELVEFFQDKLKDQNPTLLIDGMLSSLNLPTELIYRFSFDSLKKLDRSNVLKFWQQPDAGQDELISMDDVVRVVLDNNNVFKTWLDIIAKRDRRGLLSSNELKICTYKAFLYHLSKRRSELKELFNEGLGNEGITLDFALFYPNQMKFKCTRMQLAQQLLESGYTADYMEDYIDDRDYDSILNMLSICEFEDVQCSSILKIFDGKIRQLILMIPDFISYYFNNDKCRTLFYENFENEIMDVADEKLQKQNTPGD